MNKKTSTNGSVPNTYEIRKGPGTRTVSSQSTSSIASKKPPAPKK